LKFNHFGKNCFDKVITDEDKTPNELAEDERARLAREEMLYDQVSKKGRRQSLEMVDKLVTDEKNRRRGEEIKVKALEELQRDKNKKDADDRVEGERKRLELIDAVAGRLARKERRASIELAKNMFTDEQNRRVNEIKKDEEEQKMQRVLAGYEADKLIEQERARIIGENNLIERVNQAGRRKSIEFADKSMIEEQNRRISQAASNEEAERKNIARKVSGVICSSIQKRN